MMWSRLAALYVGSPLRSQSCSQSVSCALVRVWVDMLPPDVLYPLALPSTRWGCLFLRSLMCVPSHLEPRSLWTQREAGIAAAMGDV